MPSESPLLTIAIPTYNRSEYLAQLLTALAPQLEREPRVELLISDNASPDNTQELIRSYRARGLSFRYIRNETNIGADANFLQCFKEAAGKYVWLVGDDDIIAPGSLNKITDLLQSSDYALVYLSPFPFRGHHPSGRERDRLGRFAQRIPNGPSFVRIVGPMFTFISAIIINKARFMELQGNDLESFIGTNLIQLGWCLPVLASGGESLIVWDKVLQARVGNSGGYGICRVFSDNLDRVMMKAIPESEEIKRILVNISLRDWFPTTIIQIRYSEAGTLEDEDFARLLRGSHSRNWRFWVYVLPVVEMPRIAAHIWWVASQFQLRTGRLLRLFLSYPRWRVQMIRPN